MSDKKVLAIGNNSGGMYDFRGMLLSRLISLGYSVAVSTPFDTNVEDLEKLGVRMIRTELDRRGTNPLKDLKLMRAYSAVLQQEKPDLVLTYTIKPNIYGCYQCRRKKIPYAATIAGAGTIFQGEGLLKRFIIRMYRASLKSAEAVFFENCENRELFVSLGICRDSQAVLLNGAGVDLDYFTVAPFPEDNAETRFLFVGRIMEEKGFGELYEAVKRLRSEGFPCRLDVLGHHDDDSFVDKVEQAQSEGWLKFHGYRLDVRPFIERAHCFVLPSWHEGMANTNLECAAMGRPVITSNIHGCLEAVEDGVSGFLCEKKNADSLYRAMKRFVSLTPESRKKMGLAGRERMERCFDRRVVVNTILERLGVQPKQES